MPAWKQRACLGSHCSLQYLEFWLLPETYSMHNFKHGLRCACTHNINLQGVVNMYITTFGKSGHSFKFQGRCSLWCTRAATCVQESWMLRSTVVYVKPTPIPFLWLGFPEIVCMRVTSQVRCFWFKIVHPCIWFPYAFAVLQLAKNSVCTETRLSQSFRYVSACNSRLWCLVHLYASYASLMVMWDNKFISWHVFARFNPLIFHWNI